MRLITIDPGGWKHAAWAMFEEENLTACGMFRAKDFDGLRCDLDWLTQNRFYFEEAILEIPQVYKPRNQKGRQSDLIGLAVVSGACAQAIGAMKSTFVEPRRWKGTVRKDVMTARIKRKLSAAELRLVEGGDVPPSLQHNVLDAIGIGLWRLNRL